MSADTPLGARVAADWVAYNAHRYPGEPSLENADTGEAWTWRQTEDRVGRLAAVLSDRLGVRSGDRVAVLAANHPRQLEIQFACWRVGAVFVPLNWRLAAAELQHCLGDAEPAVLVHDTAWAELAHQVGPAAGVSCFAGWGGAGSGLDLDAEADAAAHRPASGENSLDQPAQLLYTSGTTGRPKGAICTLSTLIWHSLNIAGPANVSGAGDRHFASLPLFHAGGLNGVTNPVLLGGGCVRVAARFDPAQTLAQLGDPSAGVTHFSGPPFAYLSMASLPEFDRADFTGMRYGQLGGGYLDGEMAGAYAARGIELLSTYGATEMGPSVTSMTPGAAAGKIGSCGFPVQHTQVRLVDSSGADVAAGEVGEVWVRGPAITPGYWRHDPGSCFEPGGWFRSGDAMKVDEDGFFSMTGRFKDMYKSGGENVFAAEVEDVLIGHPDVAEIGIVGIPDPKWGEVGRAVVVAKPGTEPTLESIVAYGGARLARYKLPKSVVLVEELPRNGAGKVVKARLRQLHGSSDEQGGSR
jgi:fatty-acyl-CoA synthase